MKKFFIILGLFLLLAFSTFGESESESSQVLLTSASGSNIDIDGNERFDALTDGLLILRGMFGLTGTSLISGSVPGDATYTEATDIESRIIGLGDRLDIDGNGNIDALTDGLIVLRYLFGLTGDTLVKGVVAADANRVSAAEIEAHMAVLTSLEPEPPVITSSANYTAAENQTTIGTATATVATSASISFTVSGFDLEISSDGVLSFITAPDYETKSTYTAVITASDGTNVTVQDIIVSVSDIDEAPIMGALNYTADENQTSIGRVVATDPEGEAVSFSVSGSEFLITSDGVLRFALAPDYETQSSYTATITATDGTNAVTESVNVNVGDVDDVAPVFSSSASFSAAENQTAIGTVTATDVDTDNASIVFYVSGSELSITSAGVLAFASAPDYETKTAYIATVTATDGTNSTTQSITVNVTNLNDNSPVFASLATFSAAENQTSIGTVTATDADASDSVTFTVSGSELSISSAGVLSFASAPDYETKPSYTATVTATDGTNITTQNITINVTNLNDNSPVFTSSATFSVAENQANIGTVTGTDADASDSVTFTVSGSELSITSAGVLSFVSAPDYEAKTAYTATVTATDGTNSTTQSITVNVTNLNDNSPVFTSSATFSAAENQTSIGTVTATDADAGDSVTFTVSGSELSITSAGVLSFASAPDYEAKTSYTATVTAADGTNSTTQSITVGVTNVNERPVITSGSLFSSNENQTSIGYIVAEDDSESLIYELSGTDASSLSINNATGQMTFVSAPDYETKSNYSAIARVYDDEFFSQKAFQVSINNLNDNVPSITSSATFAANENQTSAGTITATDADGDSLTYSILGADASSFSINDASGVLTFNAAPDYESKTSYSATITASDGVNSTSQNITVNINNLNDNSPSFTSSATLSANENQTVIGTVSAADADGDAVSFSVTGTDASSVTINSSSGVLAFNSAPDYETKNSFSIIVTASDGSNSTNQSVTIIIGNLNDNAPVITSSNSFSTDEIDERIENDISWGNLAATDADGDSLTFGFHGDSAGSISGGLQYDNTGRTRINMTTGEITAYGTSYYDFEDGSYNTVQKEIYVTDGQTNVTQQITLSITDINDRVPDLSALSSAGCWSIGENSTSVCTIPVTDADTINTFTYSISQYDYNDQTRSGFEKLQVDSNGNLSFKSPPNYEDPEGYENGGTPTNDYYLKLTVSDGENTATSYFSVGVTNNDEPAFLELPAPYRSTNIIKTIKPTYTDALMKGLNWYPVIQASGLHFADEDNINNHIAGVSDTRRSVVSDSSSLFNLTYFNVNYTTANFRYPSLQFEPSQIQNLVAGTTYDIPFTYQYDNNSLLSDTIKVEVLENYTVGVSQLPVAYDMNSWSFDNDGSVLLGAGSYGWKLSSIASGSATEIDSSTSSVMTSSRGDINTAGTKFAVCSNQHNLNSEPVRGYFDVYEVSSGSVSQIGSRITHSQETHSSSTYCDIMINEDGTRVLVSDSSAQTYGHIYHYQLQDGDWQLIQTISGPSGNINEQLGLPGRWDSDNSLLRIMIADTYGNYSENSDGFKDYFYTLKLNSINNQYEFSFGRQAFPNPTEVLAGEGKVSMSGDGETIIYSNKTDKDNDGSLDDVISRQFYKIGGTGCSENSQAPAESYNCYGSILGQGLTTVEGAGNWLSTVYFNPTTNLLVPFGQWYMLNSYQINSDASSINNNGSRVVLTQDQKYFHVFDKGKDYRAVSYSSQPGDYDYNYTLRANPIGSIEQDSDTANEELSCGSKHGLSPDGNTLIIPIPPPSGSDSTYSCRNYRILKYPN